MQRTCYMLWTRSGEGQRQQIIGEAGIDTIDKRDELPSARSLFEGLDHLLEMT